MRKTGGGGGLRERGEVWERGGGEGKTADCRRMWGHVEDTTYEFYSHQVKTQAMRFLVFIHSSAGVEMLTHCDGADADELTNWTCVDELTHKTGPSGALSVVHTPPLK